MADLTRRAFIAGLVASSSIGLPQNARADDPLDGFEFMTEDYPPYSYERQGVLRGISVDIVTELFKRVHSRHSRDSIRMLTWARGYNITLQHAGHALFSATRTTDREHLFKWVGPFVPTVVGLTAPRSRNLKIDSMEDLYGLRVGVVKDDVGHLVMKSRGFPENRMEIVVSNGQNYRKLLAGRLDAIAYETQVTRWGLREWNADPEQYEMVYELKRSHLYLALNRSTPDEIVNQLQDAFDSMVADGSHRRILARYES